MAESGLYSDQDHIEATGGEAPLSALGRGTTAGIVPLAALGLLGVTLLLVGTCVNFRSVRPAAA